MGFSTTISCLSVAGATFVGYLLYKETSSPDVIEYMEQDKNEKRKINLVINNIGKSAAKNVKFTYDKKICLFAFHEKRAKEAAEGALVNGIPFLAPGAK